MRTKKIKINSISKKIFFFFLLFLLSACTTTTYYLVRHAEKTDSSVDPELSEAGQLRAVALKDSLLTKNIHKIFVTNYKRTQQTAMPIALATSLYKTIIQATATSALIDSLQKIKNENILIVGHSNTIPVIIDSLMKKPQNISIPENDFDNFFTVTIKRGLKTRRNFKATTYGLASP
jgi:broad specificity phosphatase PhoE